MAYLPKTSRNWRDIFGPICPFAVTTSFGSTTDRDTTTQTVTVPGAAVGDFCFIFCDLPQAKVQVSGEVTAANTVTLTAAILNNGGGAVNPTDYKLHGFVAKKAGSWGGLL